jgi:hypothetical protein
VQVVDQVFSLKETTLSAFFEFKCLYANLIVLRDFVGDAQGIYSQIEPVRRFLSMPF